MKIHFILSHPAVPENIGFACRAMKTMGFENLLLIHPPDQFDHKTLKTAYGAHDILKSAQVHGDLSSAIANMDLVIGTTAKNRVGRHDYHTPEALTQIIGKKAMAVNDIALVFGSEKNGLSNQEIAQCDLLTTIPLATSHPSLNLAQAVMVYTYEISKAHRPSVQVSSSDHSDRHQTKLKSEAIALLDYLEIDKKPSLYLRLKDRIMAATAEDTSLMLSLTRYLKRKLS